MLTFSSNNIFYFIPASIQLTKTIYINFSLNYCTVYTALFKMCITAYCILINKIFLKMFSKKISQDELTDQTCCLINSIIQRLNIKKNKMFQTRLVFVSMPYLCIHYFINCLIKVYWQWASKDYLISIN